MNNKPDSNNPKIKYNWFGDYRKKNGTLQLPVGGKVLQYIVASALFFRAFQDK